MSYTEAQEKLVTALDDTSEHVHWEFDKDEYKGNGEKGSAEISDISGRKSFVRSVKTTAKNDNISYVIEDGDGYKITVGGVELRLSKDQHGYCLSVSNTRDIVGGIEYRRLDVQERIHLLALQRLRMHGYLLDARLQSQKN